MNFKGVSISLPESLIELIDQVKEDRQDATRSDTFRVLVLKALASMSYLKDHEKKALGVEAQ